MENEKQVLVEMLEKGKDFILSEEMVAYYYHTIKLDMLIGIILLIISAISLFFLIRYSKKDDYDDYSFIVIVARTVCVITIFVSLLLIISQIYHLSCLSHYPAQHIFDYLIGKI